MDVPQLSPQLIDALRTWFHPKDRSVYLAPSTFAYLPGGVGYLSMAFISETVLSASASSVTFSNIPQGFRHLLLFSHARSDVAGELDILLARINSDSGANYDYHSVYAFGTTFAADPFRAANFMGIGLTEGANSRGNAFSPSVDFFLNYTASADKTALGLTMAYGNVSADADLFTQFRSGRWRNLNVITSITLLLQLGTNFVSGSRFQLYGIL